MPRHGHKYTPEQCENVRRGHLGQPAWNKGTGGCKRGHDPLLYRMVPSGVYLCFGCKRENSRRYKTKNKEAYLLKNRIRRYGLSHTAFQVLWEKQHGTCAICHTPFVGKKYRIDHDHQTGVVRGLLCTSCNSGIGLFQDSPALLSQAIDYLTIVLDVSWNGAMTNTHAPRRHRFQRNTQLSFLGGT